MMRQVHIRKIHDKFGRSKAAAMAKVRKGREGRYILLEEDDFQRLMVKTIHGAGDIVQKAAKVTGAEKAVKKFFPDCGCWKRQKKLNKAMPL